MVLAMAKKRTISFAEKPAAKPQVSNELTLSDPLEQHRQDVSADFGKIRSSVLDYIASGDAKLVEAGGQLWEKAVKAQRLNLGLPSEIIAASLQVGPAVPVTKMSGPRSL